MYFKDACFEISSLSMIKANNTKQQNNQTSDKLLTTIENASEKQLNDV